MNLSTGVPRGQLFFGRELIEHGRVKTIEKPIEKKHSAFLGINVIDMYICTNVSSASQV